MKLPMNAKRYEVNSSSKNSQSYDELIERFEENSQTQITKILPLEKSGFDVFVKQNNIQAYLHPNRVEIEAQEDILEYREKELMEEIVTFYNRIQELEGTIEATNRNRYKYAGRDYDPDMANDEPQHPRREKQVVEELKDGDEPLTTEELSTRLDLDPNEVGEIASDLVVGNKASINSRREYRLL